MTAIRLSEDLREAVDRAIADEGGDVSRSEFIRAVLAQHLATTGHLAASAGLATAVTTTSGSVALVRAVSTAVSMAMRVGKDAEVAGALLQRALAAIKKPSGL